MIVLDNSALLNLLLRSDGIAIERLQPSDGPLAAPHHIDLECMNALKRMLRLQTIDRRKAEEIVRGLAELNIERHSVSRLIDDIWNLRDNFGIYDAAYVCLAWQLNAQLITSDGRLA